MRLGRHRRSKRYISGFRFQPSATYHVCAAYLRASASRRSRNSGLPPIAAVKRQPVQALYALLAAVPPVGAPLRGTIVTAPHFAYYRHAHPAATESGPADTPRRRVRVIPAPPVRRQADDCNSPYAGGQFSEIESGYVHVLRKRKSDLTKSSSA